MTEAEAHFMARIGTVFEIDDRGRIWRIKDERVKDPDAILRRRAEVRDSLGYLQIRFNRHGRFIAARAHRLVWINLHGDIPAGYEPNHKSGIKNDNRPENLELVTRSQNVRHAIEVLGRNIVRYGEENPTSKLKEAQVEEILRRYYQGERQCDLAQEFGVAKTNIQAIAKGRNWAAVFARVFPNGPSSRIAPAKRLPMGSRHHSAKLTEQQVIEIRAQRKTGTPTRDLARQYGVSVSEIKSIAKGKVWRHVVL